DALISTGLADLGYNYGHLVPESKTFPSGIKAVADYVHEKNLKLVRPGSLFHENDDAASWASWGVDYLKYDNCFNLGIKPIDRYPTMRDALNATGRKIFYSLCEWGEDDPALWAGNVGNSWRTTDDINDTWASMTSIADLNDKWAAYAGPGGWNDPDMLEVGNGGMTYLEYRSHFSIWALMKVVSTWNSGKESQRYRNRWLSPGPYLRAFVDLKKWLWAVRVWAGPLSGNRFAIVLWNRCSEGGTINVSWDSLGLESSVSVSVRDLWKARLLYSFNPTLKHEDVVADAVASFGVHVGAHSCEMFVLTPKLTHS
ncbi:hypothetical protein M8C21_006518, partial [Ambrosia artemisiifolia]